MCPYFLLTLVTLGSSGGGNIVLIPNKSSWVSQKGKNSMHQRQNKSNQSQKTRLVFPV